MNTRERFLQLMNFKPGTRSLKWEWAYWKEAILRWRDEKAPLEEADIATAESEETSILIGGGYLAAPNDPQDISIRKHFGMDRGIVRVPIDVFLLPLFEREVLSESDDFQIIREFDGSQRKSHKNRPGMPQFLRYAIRNRSDFERLKVRLDPDDPRRFPEDWDRFVTEAGKRDYPLALGNFHCGFFGILNELIGIENLSYLIYDEPDLIHAIVDYFTDFWLALFMKVLDLLDVDFIHFWEDMAFKTGPLVSPAVFREFMLPCYKKMIGALRERGETMFFVDSDGNLWDLLPLFREAGITGVYPLEVAAGMDVGKVRKEYPRLQMMGGVDKRAIARGRDAIDSELERVGPVLKTGGYVPFIDHCVPPDVSWENFSYYRNRLNDLIGG